MDGFTHFAILNGEVLIKPMSDRRTCREWVLDQGYPKEQWESAVRGYVAKNTVQFYTGKNYTCVHTVPASVLKTLTDYHMSLYGCAPKNFYDGLARKAGVDCWQPVRDLHCPGLSAFRGS